MSTNRVCDEPRNQSNTFLSAFSTNRVCDVTLVFRLYRNSDNPENRVCDVPLGNIGKSYTVVSTNRMCDVPLMRLLK